MIFRKAARAELFYAGIEDLDVRGSRSPSGAPLWMAASFEPRYKARMDGAVVADR